MIWLRLIFGGLIKRIIGALSAFMEWAKQNPAWALLVVTAFASGLYIWHITGQRDDARKSLAATKNAFAVTVAGYRTAQQLAEQAQAENLARVAREFEENADEQIASYQSSAADYRGRFERLRAARRNQSGASNAAMPTLPEAAGGTPPADHDPGQPADPEMIAIRIDDLEALVNGALQGESIRKLWISNEDVETSPDDRTSQ